MVVLALIFTNSHECVMSSVFGSFIWTERPSSFVKICLFVKCSVCTRMLCVFALFPHFFCSCSGTVWRTMLYAPFSELCVICVLFCPLFAIPTNSSRSNEITNYITHFDSNNSRSRIVLTIIFFSLSLYFKHFVSCTCQHHFSLFRHRRRRRREFILCFPSFYKLVRVYIFVLFSFFRSKLNYSSFSFGFVRRFHFFIFSTFLMLSVSYSCFLN